MGQQQLLLVLLGIVIIGIAIALSISLFRQSAIDNKRDLLINECISLGNMAQGYYKKPAMLGGGGYSFEGWNFPEQLRTTAAGSYIESVSGDNIVITGTGNEVVTGNDSIKVQVTVYPDTFSTEVIN